MEGDTPEVVSLGSLEGLLAQVRDASPVPEEGIFGPGSVSWKVNRESALFLAAGRAALLQLAHPWVASAIAEHSRTLNDPIGRFHQTFRTMFTIVFGPVEQVIGAARHLHHRHAGIRGSLPEAAGKFPRGSHYEANEVSALRWVYATLVDSALLAYELVLPPLSDSERERYYAESLRTAALFGIPADGLPADWPGFRLYLNSMLGSDELAVTAGARRMAQQLQAGAGLRLRPPFWYAALTTSLLPSHLRSEFQLPDTKREQRSAVRAVRWLRRMYPRLPDAVRFVGPYREVQALLAGHKYPSTITRLSNRLWIGVPSLLGPKNKA